MSSAEIKAEEYMSLAEKSLKKFSIFSSSNKYEEASDYYEKAANQYKLAKKWIEAGENFNKCAEMQMKLKESSRAAHFYQSAADSISKGSIPTDSIKYYEKAITMLCDAGRFSNAAKLKKLVGEIYENDMNNEKDNNYNIIKSIENYQQAADFFQAENQSSSANSLLLKVAELSASRLEKYDEAIEIYENVARSCMESNLLKFNAKGHLLNAGLCALAKKDIVVVKQKKDIFNEIDYTFHDSREGKFYNDLADSYENYDMDGFADAVYQFDNISKLDAWKISVLLRVKESMGAGVEEVDDLT